MSEILQTKAKLKKQRIALSKARKRYEAMYEKMEQSGFSDESYARFIAAVDAEAELIEDVVSLEATVRQLEDQAFETIRQLEKQFVQLRSEARVLELKRDRLRGEIWYA